MGLSPNYIITYYGHWDDSDTRTRNVSELVETIRGAGRVQREVANSGTQAESG